MSLNKIVILLIIIQSINNAQAAIPERVGWWKFDNASNLTIAENGYGQNLTLVGSNSAVAGPESGNGATQIGVGSYYKMNHLISPNGGGTKVNEYTLQYDFKVTGNNTWHSFFQTSLTNADDGDFFINPTGNIGVGDVGYSGYSVIPNEWYRLLVSVKNGKNFTCYLDGQLLLMGTIQSIDGRFSLADMLLIFADENGEDASINCAELAIWNQALSAAQANELGGFGHVFSSVLMTKVPYLQGQGQTTMNVCWHDTAQTGTTVEYGFDSLLLNLATQGSNELISYPYRWHSAKLTGLLANTRYFYRVASGGGKSEIYSFKTLPDSTYSAKLRFVLFSDTHSSDSTAVGKVLRASRAKITELYGPDIENHLNGIFHSGDVVVSGNVPEQYTTQYFKPMAALSSNIPTMVVAGNHEGESPYFYQYLKLDDQSVFPTNAELNEKIWDLKIGNSLFIGLNTNITTQFGTIMANWLDTKLNEVENDATIDFVFIFLHHSPISELWGETNTWEGSIYVTNVLYPILKKYTKVQQINTGHTHGFERGTILSNKPNGDFRTICGGGSGGALDTWGSYINNDYEDIHIALDHYCFQILEIDLADHSYKNTMYSLGNEKKPRNSEALDTWYKKTNQNGPETPVADNVVITDENVQFNSSQFSGVDSLMSVRLQVFDSIDPSSIVIDTIIHWKNIYGVDNKYNPIDKNAGINLYQVKVKSSLFEANKTYLYNVRYRDHNLRWSNWSDKIFFKIVGTGIGSDYIEEGYLKQNFPNPFQNTTRIEYHVPVKSEVTFRFLNAQNQLVALSNEGIKEQGTHSFLYNGENLDAGIYYYQLISQKTIITKEMVKIN